MTDPRDDRSSNRPASRSLPDKAEPSIALDELFEVFILASGSIINDRTEANYQRAWDAFRAWLDGQGLEPILGALSEDLFVAYIAQLQRRPKQKGAGTLSSYSVHAYVRVLRTFVRWLVARGFYPSDPFAGGGRGIMPRLGPRVLKVARIADVERLLVGSDGGRTVLEQAIRGRDEAIVWLDADTGLRTGEVCRLAIGDVDFADGWVLIRKSKWDRERRVPLSRETIAALRVYQRRSRPTLSGVHFQDVRPDDPLFLSGTGRHLTPNAVYQAMTRAFRRGGGTGPFGLHRIRHHWGTRALDGGMHPRVSQELMGHEDPKSQAPYQHPSDATKREQHARVTPLRDLRPSRRRRLA
jgi:integrase